MNAKLCHEHPTEPLVLYCRDCEVAVCSVCCAAEHDTHHAQSLVDVTASPMRELKKRISDLEAAIAQLESMGAQTAPATSSLHAYIDDEVGGLIEVLEEQRATLHADVDSRAQRMRDMLRSEMTVCDEELRCIADGQAVLDAIAASEGLVNAPVGELIHARMSYDAFAAATDPVLHEPPKMLHLLRLQLPIQNLQEMVERLRWTDDV